MLKQILLTNRQIYKIIIKNVEVNEIIEILFLKKSKSDEIISFKFQIIDIHNQKTTR